VYMYVHTHTYTHTHTHTHTHAYTHTHTHTSVTPLGRNKLLSSYEGGLPFLLDADSLETLGGARDFGSLHVLGMMMIALFIALSLMPEAYKSTYLFPPPGYLFLSGALHGMHFLAHTRYDADRHLLVGLGVFLHSMPAYMRVQFPQCPPPLSLPRPPSLPPSFPPSLPPFLPPSLPPLSISLAHTYTHTHTHSLPPSLPPSLSLSLSLSLSRFLSLYSGVSLGLATTLTHVELDADTLECVYKRTHSFSPAFYVQ
jgi:hypothetical protein